MTVTAGPATNLSFRLVRREATVDRYQDFPYSEFILNPMLLIFDKKKKILKIPYRAFGVEDCIDDVLKIIYNLLGVCCLTCNILSFFFFSIFFFLDLAVFLLLEVYKQH